MVQETKLKTIRPSEISLEAQIEALLFVAPDSVTVSQIASALEIKPIQVKKGLKNLKETYSTRGIKIQWHRDRVRLTTSPETAEIVEKFLALEATSRLSRAALETLSIIAYQQPVTRPTVDSIRGVNSDGVIRNLLSKGLIEEAGRAEGLGRPILYITTSEFLQHFGLTSIDELPPLGNESEWDQSAYSPEKEHQPKLIKE
jgi:segregation and condensation protein B